MAPWCSALTFLLTATGAFAAGIPRGTVSPAILSPSGLSQWSLGSVQTVRWALDQDLSGINGTVYMGYLPSNNNPFLWKDQPLAENFSLTDGVVNVRCPLNLPTGGRYVIALSIDGDDSDISTQFSVIDQDDPNVATTSSPPATLSTTGNIPSATISRTSVVSVIGSPTSTLATDSSSKASTSTASKTSSATEPGPTGGAGTTNGSSKTIHAGMSVGIAAVLVAFWTA
ncbi:hypothetical protein GY45DRAFT_1346877 [Cubamyces sp. BRFM 1775]|nr:hypothetical protein GY45DRAFT_1346877 [Cubamyces sp. BRFM 1775]